MSRFARAKVFEAAEVAILQVLYRVVRSCFDKLFALCRLNFRFLRFFNRYLLSRDRNIPNIFIDKLFGFTELNRRMPFHAPFAIVQVQPKRADETNKESTRFSL